MDTLLYFIVDSLYTSVKKVALIFLIEQKYNLYYFDIFC